MKISTEYTKNLKKLIRLVESDDFEYIEMEVKE